MLTWVPPAVGGKGKKGLNAVSLKFSQHNHNLCNIIIHQTEGTGLYWNKVI